ncbi:putative ribonucleotide reductase of class Ia (Aerobic), beta subunit [Ralstonia phage RP31]|uniref:ribonucleoside-diphosphate reductase n=2 Tax=Ripduovirus RP12 TaxID=2560700 RepID=A0A1L7N0X7_9CAUD|nr:putative ribonucleotide reductase of class Ia (Aerobic), beta subunit [Ralstonia phage RP12]BAW19129.1 putative ribonucleotide reductase of class Ia (Aerobic), beta subunit [Ralstonia phage RP12]BAW19415.1 putative ribonucleotide reductase of class Ia (Aerobic), beta subunit [Ralstonia phage RP31]
MTELVQAHNFETVDYINLSLAQRGETLNPAIFNLHKTDYEKPELFLGQPGGLLDTIHRPYPDIFRLYEELKSMDWKHNEFDYSRCMPEFKTCSPSIYRMMIRTLAWQWEGDSVAARGLAEVMVPFCTATEIRCGYVRIADNENLHALTYSEIVRGSFEDPSAILNEILSVREAHGRMAVVGEIFAKASAACLEWQLTRKRTKEMEQAVVLLVAAVYMLERIQFMASFAVTFGICELGLFEPIGSAIQLIARDEYNNHVPYGEEVLRNLLATEWGRAAFQAVRPIIIRALIELLRNEMSWVDYLHSDGDELPGVTPQKLKDWSLFNGRHVCVTFGVLAEVEMELGVQMPQQLPLNYMRDWIDINEKQSSPQEQDNNQYLINTVSTENVSKEVIGGDIDLGF